MLLLKNADKGKQTDINRKKQTNTTNAYKKNSIYPIPQFGHHHNHNHNITIFLGNLFT